jgi:hypothetical protein
MSDWADFCQSVGINPGNPNEFDDWLASQQKGTHRQEFNAPLGLTPRQLMARLANPLCARCRGTGYLGRYSWNCGGRCFACIPDENCGGARQ